MIDEETQQIIIKKTWCHGQLVAPIYSIVLLWWYFASDDDDVLSKWTLWIPMCYFRFWCYLSYKNIVGTAVDLSISKITWGGLMTEVCHIIVLIQSLKNIQNTMNLLLCISSTLFLIKTATFLLDVCTLGPRNDNSNSIEQLPDSASTGGGGNYQYHDTM
jgi:hypothetical protein